MKKKSLFLIVCTVLLLLAVAGPAAADGAYYCVSPYEPFPTHNDPAAGTISFVTAIPAGSPVVFGYPWRALNRGLAATVPSAFRMRLTVTAPNKTVIAHCDESDCLGYWHEVFRWNDVFGHSPDWLGIPYNPKAAAAGMWARVWLVPCGNLPVGTYTCTYNDMQLRTVADPMWEQPGSYPPVYPSYEWPESPMVFTFEVVEQ
jgi:hypothetical protein